MKLPVDTSAIAFLCALEPQPLLDFETRQPRADSNGEPLYVVQLIALAEGEAEILAVKVPGHPWVCARATRSRSTAWWPSPGPWPTARAWRSGRTTSSQCCVDTLPSEEPGVDRQPTGPEHGQRGANRCC